MSAPPQFEWQFAEHEDEWTALTASRTQPAHWPAWQRWRSPWLWGLVGVVLMAAGSGVYALDHTGQAGWQAIETELQNAVAADAWQAQPAAATVQVIEADVHGSQALVQAVVTQTLSSGETVAYQTTDFYTESAAGWVRSAPSPALLGPAQTLTTEHLAIRYYHVDAPVVRALAPRLEALYVQACVSFGLPPTRPAHPILITLSAEPRLVAGLVVSPPGDVIVIPSPVLLQLPAAQPPDEGLYQAAAEPLVELVLQQATGQAGSDPHGFRWQPLLDALRLWQVWQAGGALAGERVEVIRRFYVRTSSASFFPMCETSSLWRLTGQLVVRLCLELVDPSLPPQRLNLLADADPVYTHARARPWGELVALETLVEYAVAQYGPERLPVLLRALDDYDTWNILIPAVYGVSVADFEQGWQDYVVAHYR